MKMEAECRSLASNPSFQMPPCHGTYRKLSLGTLESSSRGIIGKLSAMSGALEGHLEVLL